MIEFTNVTKTYPNGTKALKNIDLRIKKWMVFQLKIIVLAIPVLNSVITIYHQVLLYLKD